MDEQKKLVLIEEIRDAVKRVDRKYQPFLYFLPDLLLTKDLSRINPEQALQFIRLSFKHEKLPIMLDALHILNRTINPEDGSLKTPARDIFYDNRSFFWNELGSYTKAVDVILHIFNKTIFHLSAGNNL